ncbi:hypothetical protein CM49_05680 [Paenibacillus sp. P1XP2]|nr:hypothetical protein CM49_05680 [Paenibacillus sp. P1XP2]
METVHQVISLTSGFPGMKERLQAIFKELFGYLEKNRDWQRSFTLSSSTRPCLWNRKASKSKTFKLR